MKPEQISHSEAGKTLDFGYNHQSKSDQWRDQRNAQLESLAHTASKMNSVEDHNAAKTILALRDTVDASRSIALEQWPNEGVAEYANWDSIQIDLDRVAAEKGQMILWDKVRGRFGSLESFLQFVLADEEEMPHTRHKAIISIDHIPSFKWDRSSLGTKFLAKGSGFRSAVRENDALNIHEISMDSEVYNDMLTSMQSKRMTAPLDQAKRSSVEQSLHEPKNNLAANLNMEVQGQAENTITRANILTVLELYDINADDEGFVDRMALIKPHNELFWRLDSDGVRRSKGGFYKYANSELTYRLLGPNDLKKTNGETKVKLDSWIDAVLKSYELRSAQLENGDLRWENDIIPTIQTICKEHGLDDGWLISRLRDELNKLVKTQTGTQLFAGRTGGALFAIQPETLEQALSVIKSQLNQRTRPYQQVLDQL